MPEIPFAHQWTISENQLLSLKNSLNGHITSSKITNIPEIKYYLEICSNGITVESRRKIWICLHLKFKDVKKVEIDFTITIESSKYSHTIRSKVYEKSKGWGYRICPTKEFFDSEKKYIVDGKFVLKIYGFFKYETGNAVSDIIQEYKWEGGEFGNELWENDDIKDFTIICEGDKQIKVHKFILLSRSDFFKEMLNTCATDSSVEITDFSFIVVETALKIIYNCNFTSKLSIDELMELLQFFDKYLFSTFRDKVEPLLIAKISPSTVVRLTNCSIQTNSFTLKEKCMEFLIAAFESKTALADIEILDKNIGMKILLNLLYQPLETE